MKSNRVNPIFSQMRIEWREIGKQAWNYVIDTRGKSRGELNRLITGWRARNPIFEFRITTWAGRVGD